MVKVVQRGFPLQSKLMESIEAVKCEDSLWLIECGREPASTQELNVSVNDAI